MSFLTLSQWGPITTSPTIKHLIIWTSVLSILSAVIQSICDQFGVSPGPQQLFSLSLWGMENLYLWQPLTFLFIQPYSPSGITFFSLISLFFTMYILWVIGTAIYDLIGRASFLRFYFFCGIITGITTLLIMPLIGKYTMLAGPAPAILALLTVWSMAYPESEVLLFFLIPVKAKWIIAGLAGALLLTTLSQWDIISLFLYASSIVVGYFYACLAWGWHSPFPLTQKIDSFLATIGFKMKRYLVIPQWLKFSKNKKTSPSRIPGNKVIDIETASPLANDDTFIDQMLAKISKHGERSLTWGERRRMQQISESKRKKQDS